MSEAPSQVPGPRLTSLASTCGCAAKVPPGELRRIIGQLGHAGGARHANVLVGTETGDDAAVIRLRDDLALVFTTDFIPPVCDDPFLYGQIAAANAISDVFAMGGQPIAALAVCAFPEALPAEVAHEIMAGATAKAEEAGCPIVGGHTVRNAELLFGLAVTGTVDPRRIIRNAGACVGDALILTKRLGTGIMVNAARAGKLDAERARAVLATMAALNRIASEVMQAEDAHAATDVTGFGLAGHALGMARASGVSLRVRADALPIHDGAVALYAAGVKTRATGTNRDTFATAVQVAADVSVDLADIVYDAQTSGGLLLAVAPAAAERALIMLRDRGIDAAAIIGEVVPKGPDGDSALSLM